MVKSKYGSSQAGNLLRLIVALVFLSVAGVAKAAAAATTKTELPPDWEKAVTAAENEGQVTLYGPPGITYQNAINAFRDALPKIKLVYVPGSGTNNAQRLMPKDARKNISPTSLSADPELRGRSNGRRRPIIIRCVEISPKACCRIRLQCQRTKANI